MILCTGPETYCCHFLWNVYREFFKIENNDIQQMHFSEVHLLDIIILNIAVMFFSYELAGGGGIITVPAWERIFS
jgi:hypothetical protein